MANTFRSESYNSGKSLGFVLQVIFAVLILFALVNILASAFMLISPDSSIDLGDGDRLDVALLIIGLVAIAEIVVRLACIVIFLVWLYRVFGNLPLIGARNLEFSPGWAIGWWFVPFLNLVKPYQVVKELYVESKIAKDISTGESSSDSSENVGLWWATFIVAGIVLRVSDAMFDGTNDQPSQYFPVAYLVGHIIFAVAAWFAIVIVRNVNQWQELAIKNQEPIQTLVPPPPPTFDEQG